MKRNINSSWQEWVIAIALVVILPATVWLGLQVVAPKVEYQNYSKICSSFFEKYREKKYRGNASDEEYKKLDAKWKKTETFKVHEYQLCTNNFVKLCVGGTLSVVLLYIGSVFVMPIIASSCMMSALILHTMCASWGSFCPIVFGINMHLLSILFALVGLLIILRAAYRDSQN